MAQPTSGGNVNPANLNFPGLNTRTLLDTDFLIVARPGFQNVKATIAEVNAGGHAVNISDLVGGADDDLIFKLAGTWTPTGGLLTWDGSTLKITGAVQMENATGPIIVNEAATITNPVFIPDRTQLTTGVVGRGSGFNQVGFSVVSKAAVIYEGFSSGVLQTNFEETGLVASTTQTQGGALQLNASYNEVATVANVGDALRAPPAAEGERLTIINNGANQAQLFPIIGDDLGAGVNNPINIDVGNIAIFLGRDSVNWDTLFNASPTPGGGSDDYILIQDQKATGTDGGTFTSGAWRTRILNTEVADTGNNATLSANQITLQPGTYRCSISAPGFEVDEHKLRLRNITDGTTEIVGSSEDSEAVAQTRSFIEGRFTIAAAKAFEVQHFCTVTGTDDGFGNTSGSIDEIAIYCSATFWKEQ